MYVAGLFLETGGAVIRGLGGLDSYSLGGAGRLGLLRRGFGQ